MVSFTSLKINDVLIASISLLMIDKKKWGSGYFELSAASKGGYYQFFFNIAR